MTTLLTDSKKKYIEPNGTATFDSLLEREDANVVNMKRGVYSLIFDSEKLLKHSIIGEEQEIRCMSETHGVCLILIDTSFAAGDNISGVERSVNNFFDEFKDTIEAEHTDMCIVSLSAMPTIVQPFTCACNVHKVVLESSTISELTATGDGAYMVVTDILNNQRRMYNLLGISIWRPLIVLITDGNLMHHGNTAFSQLKGYFDNKKCWLHVLGLPGYDDKLFSLLEVNHLPVQCDNVSDYLNKLVFGIYYH